MLDTISLSEEDLGLLFAPASHEAASSALDHHRLLRAVTHGRKPTGHARAAKHAAATPHQLKKKKAARPLTSALIGTVVPARCGYRTGKCQNLQAIKRNGRLHKLCEFHRERANLNQKKLDRKKRMQRSKGSPCESVASSEDDSASHASRSPRTVEAAVSSSVFVKSEPSMAEPELETELFLPTSLHEAPLALGCEELAIFCSLMTFDMHSHRPLRRDAHNPPCHHPTSTV